MKFESGILKRIGIILFGIIISLLWAAPVCWATLLPEGQFREDMIVFTAAIPIWLGFIYFVAWGLLNLVSWILFDNHRYINTKMYNVLLREKIKAPKIKTDGALSVAEYDGKLSRSE